MADEGCKVHVRSSSIDDGNRTYQNSNKDEDDDDNDNTDGRTTGITDFILESEKECLSSYPMSGNITKGDNTKHLRLHAHIRTCV